MTYLRGKIDRYLMDWKETQGHNPLIAKGPRQVGKTESILRLYIENGTFEGTLLLSYVRLPYGAITDRAADENPQHRK